MSYDPFLVDKEYLPGTFIRYKSGLKHRKQGIMFILGEGKNIYLYKVYCFYRNKVIVVLKAQVEPLEPME